MSNNETTVNIDKWTYRRNALLKFQTSHWQHFGLFRQNNAFINKILLMAKNSLSKTISFRNSLDHIYWRIRKLFAEQSNILHEFRLSLQQ